jgi:hypothetical protein
MTISFVAHVNADLCAIQRVGGIPAGPLPDGTIETQDDDGTWYPCNYNSFNGFYQQIYFGRTMAINDFNAGTPWRINPAFLLASPDNGTMV